MSPPINAPASTSIFTRGSRAVGADRRRKFLLADQRNRVHRDTLATDVVAIGLGDRAHRHLAHLRAAAHHDDALAVDAGERRRLLTVFDADRTQSAGGCSDRLDGDRAVVVGSVNSK